MFKLALVACCIAAVTAVEATKWSMEAEIDLGGYTAKTFSKPEQEKFRRAVGDSLKIPTSCVTIKFFENSAAGTETQLGVSKSVTVTFSIIVGSQALSEKVEESLENDTFFMEFAKAMKKEGLDPTKVDVGKVGKFVKVAKKMVIGTIAIAAGAGVAILVVGAWKLRQITDGGTAEEQSGLTK
jgi:hypothetical protein